MKDLVKQILVDNLEARQNALANLENIFADYEAKKLAYEEAQTKINELGDIESAKLKLVAEIEEINSFLNPPIEEVVESQLTAETQSE
jgi:hypothetical protein